MQSIGSLGLYLAFFGIVAIMLIIDFIGFKNNKSDQVSLKQAGYWSIAWVSVAMLFAGGLWLYLQQTASLAIANQKTLEYLSGYLLEKPLAIS